VLEQSSDSGSRNAATGDFGASSREQGSFGTPGAFKVAGLEEDEDEYANSVRLFAQENDEEAKTPERTRKPFTGYIDES
jgi:hypothetical protein